MREYGFSQTEYGSVKNPYFRILYAVNNTSDPTNSKTYITNALASLKATLPRLQLAIVLGQTTLTYKEQRQ